MSLAFFSLCPTQFITTFSVLLRHGPTAAFMNSPCSMSVDLCRFAALVMCSGANAKPLISNIVAWIRQAQLIVEIIAIHQTLFAHN
jgi:hypothetical protein